MMAESAARTSSGMDEREYRIRELTAQNDRLLELLAQSEADVAELQKQLNSSPAASPAVEHTDAPATMAEASVEELQQLVEVTRSELTTLQQRVAELNKDNAEILEAKLLEEVRPTERFRTFGSTRELSEEMI